MSLSQLRHCHHHVFIFFLSVLTIRSCSLSLLEFIPRVQKMALNLINTFYILKLQILSSNHRLHEFLCNLVEDETCFFSLTCLCSDLQAAAKRQWASWRTFCSCQENPLKWNIEHTTLRIHWPLTVCQGEMVPHIWFGFCDTMKKSASLTRNYTLNKYVCRHFMKYFVINWR